MKSTKFVNSKIRIERVVAEDLKMLTQQGVEVSITESVFTYEKKEEKEKVIITGKVTLTFTLHQKIASEEPITEIIGTLSKHGTITSFAEKGQDEKALENGSSLYHFIIVLEVAERLATPLSRFIEGGYQNVGTIVTYDFYYDPCNVYPVFMMENNNAAQSASRTKEIAVVTVD